MYFEATFYSTHDFITFCQKYNIPSNQKNIVLYDEEGNEYACLVFFKCSLIASLKETYGRSFIEILSRKV